MGDVRGRLKTVLLAGASGLLAAGGAAHAQEASAGAVQDGTRSGVTSLSLGRVVVSAGEEKVAIDTPQAVTVMDQNDIDDAQASTMGDLLQGMPGVSTMGGVSALGQGFNIRGLGTGLADSDSRILFQVDGVTKFFEQYRMGSLFSEPELYKRVEVLRGPASSTLYGAGALAGVVSFTTKDASDFLEGEDVFALRLRGGYETNAEGGFGSLIMATRPAEDFDLLLFGNKRENDHYENGDGQTVLPSNVTSETFLLKGRYYIGGARDHSLWASYQVWASESSQMYDQAEAAFGSTVRRDVQDTTAVIGYENGFSGNDWLDLTAQFSFANSDVHQTENTFAPTSLGDVSDYTYATWQGRVENTSEFSFGESLTTFVTVGLQGSVQERRNPRYLPGGGTGSGATTHPEGDMTRYGVFAQAELVWGEKLTIIPGVRYDVSEYEPGDGVPATAEDESEDGWSPKIAALYNVTDWLGVFGSVSHTIRLPVLDEIYSRSGSQTFNPDLEPEESDNYELGFTLSFDDAIARGDAFNLKLTAFRNEVENLITRGSAALSQPYFINVGESLLEGYEVEAEYGAQSWFARASYAAIEGSDEINDVPLNTIPADELNLTLGYLIPGWGLTVGWRGLFAADQDDVSGSVSPTDGYSVHDLFATWRPTIGALEGTDIRVSVENIADEQYQPHLWSLDAEGRSFKVSVGRTF